MKIIKKSNNDIILVKKDNGEYAIIDDCGDLELLTIHTYNWSCTQKEKEKYLNKIFKVFL